MEGVGVTTSVGLILLFVTMHVEWFVFVGRIKEHEDEMERLKLVHMNELQTVKRGSNWFKFAVFVFVLIFAYLML